MDSNLFKSFDDKAKRHIINYLQAKTLQFQKDSIIMSYLNNNDYIGIINEGEADILRYDYNGKRTIIEHLNKNQLFGSLFMNNDNSELNVIATTKCQVTFLKYEQLLQSAKKGNANCIIILQNLIEIIAKKLINLDKQIEILTKRTTREKILTYFEQLAKEKNNRTFNLPFSYTDLADYLSCDRSAMMREIKRLKEEGFIKEINKKITILSI